MPETNKDTAFVQKTDYVNLVRPCPGCGTLDSGWYPLMLGEPVAGEPVCPVKGASCGPGALSSLVSFDRFISGVVKEIQERMAAGKIRNW